MNTQHTSTGVISESLAGRTALVTGGSQRFGAAVVARLASAGATVMTTARNLPPEFPDPDLFVVADVSTAAGARQVVEQVGEQLGTLDILVNTVGGSHVGPGGFAALTDEQWESDIAVNLLASVRLDRGLIPGMIQAGSGAVVHVSSIQRRLPLFDATLGYAAAKAALTTYSKGLGHGFTRWYSDRPPCSAQRGRRAHRLSRFRSGQGDQRIGIRH